MSFPSNFLDGSALAPLSADIEYTKFLKAENKEEYMSAIQSNLTEEDYIKYVNGLTEICQQLRQKEYPPQEDYLDAIVKDDSDQLANYINQCLQIKSKYPKP